ncbi:hypothetical protein QJS04_geneDACA023075 [Acorus gramineus]|uniref:Uncharacterized protein n=1 Tax=Acorus gramineus TaxID=55184 RepID=A0AAV9BPN8_ACOGR|nr:hypothetical protein QJS04_geneDACA023075 [Acorus gramineus]
MHIDCSCGREHARLQDLTRHRRDDWRPSLPWLFLVIILLPSIVIVYMHTDSFEFLLAF